MKQRDYTLTKLFVIISLLIVIFSGCKPEDDLTSLPTIEDQETKYKIFIKEAPDNFINYAKLGDIYFYQNRISEAMEMYEKAYELNPKSPEINFNIGLIYDMRYDYPNAIRYYKRAVALREDYTKARINLGLVYTKLKKYESALEQFDYVIEKDEKNILGVYNKALILNKTDPEQAIVYWNRFIELAGNDPQHIYNVKKAFVHIKNCEEKLEEQKNEVK